MKDQAFLARYGLALAAALVLAGCASKSPAPLADRGGPPGTPPAAGAVAAKEGYLVRKGDTLYSIALDHGLDYKDLVAWNAIENPNLILVGQVLRVKAPGAGAGSEAVVVRPVASASSVEPRALDGAGSAAVKREPKAGKEAYSDQAMARAQALALAQQKPVEPVVASVAKVEAKPAARVEKPEAQAEPAADATSGNEEVLWMWPASGKLVGSFSEGGNKGVDISGKAGDPVLAASGGKVVYSGTGLRGYGKLVIVKHNSNYLTAYAHNQTVLVKEGQSVSKGQKIAEMGNTDADQVKLHFEVRRQGKPVDPLKHLPQR